MHGDDRRNLEAGQEIENFASIGPAVDSVFVLEGNGVERIEGVDRLENGGGVPVEMFEHDFRSVPAHSVVHQAHDSQTHHPSPGRRRRHCAGQP